MQWRRPPRSRQGRCPWRSSSWSTPGLRRRHDDRAGQGPRTVHGHGRHEDHPAIPSVWRAASGCAERPRACRRLRANSSSRFAEPIKDAPPSGRRFLDIAWKNLADAGFPDRILRHRAVAAATRTATPVASASPAPRPASRTPPAGSKSTATSTGSPSSATAVTATSWPCIRW